MKEFWNKLIAEYRKNQEMEKENNYCQGSRWLRYIARDNQRKIKEVFYKNFKKDIDNCDFM